MKVRVIKKFRDKHTHEFYKIDQELEVTKERLEEMNSTSHGVFVEAIPEEPKKEEPKQGPKKKSTKK